MSYDTSITNQELLVTATLWVLWFEGLVDLVRASASSDYMHHQGLDLNDAFKLLLLRRTSARRYEEDPVTVATGTEFAYIYTHTVGVVV